MAPTGWSRWCLLLRRHDRLTATALARELEVSTRTVLRDIEALSAAGVPVYAERGRRGGFALMPGFRMELTGLNHDEALALLVAGSRRGAQDVDDACLSRAGVRVREEGQVGSPVGVHGGCHEC